MQLCSWKQRGLLECGQVAWFPLLALGFGFVDISSEIGLSPAANRSAVAPWNHLGLSFKPSSPPLPPVGRFFLGRAWLLLPAWSTALLVPLKLRHEERETGRLRFNYVSNSKVFQVRVVRVCRCCIRTVPLVRRVCGAAQRGG